MSKEPKERKHVHWRVGELPEGKDKVNRWLDGQSNLQLSLMSLVLHMIDRFGYRDIRDHDIQKALYYELYYDQQNGLVEQNIQKNDLEVQNEQSELFSTPDHKDTDMNERKSSYLSEITSSDF